jgi:hypothetical protein
LLFVNSDVTYTVSRMPECRRPRTGGGGKVVFAPANGTLKRNVSDVALERDKKSGEASAVVVQTAKEKEPRKQDSRSSTKR